MAYQTKNCFVIEVDPADDIPSHSSDHDRRRFSFESERVAPGSFPRAGPQEHGISCRSSTEEVPPAPTPSLPRYNNHVVDGSRIEWTAAQANKSYFSAMSRPEQAENAQNPSLQSFRPSPSFSYAQTATRENIGLRRARTRKVKLSEGRVLSVDYAVPSAIRNAIQAKYCNDLESGSDEFTTLRYTAATCDPSDFSLKNGYDLRTRIYNRHTELFVGITYFNEDKDSLIRTLDSVFKNVRDICKLKKSTFWNKGGPAWQKIVVSIVLDRIEHYDPGVLDVLEALGLYKHGVMKRDVEGKETLAHIFEYTTQLSISEDYQLVLPIHDDEDTLRPIQFITCIKTHNNRKINSHRWMWMAFGRIANPEVAVTIDVGTKLRPNALLAMWESFYNDKDLGGACGEVYCSVRSLRSLFNPIVAAQHFEYKVSYQLDRALEASLGYVTVLPGAFSGYRYRAINGPPLESYFQGDPSLFQSLYKTGWIESALKCNMFLAEDRLLCFESVAKIGGQWHLGFVKGAKAATDSPTNMVDLIVQRRRWLNGAFATTMHMLSTFRSTYRTGHSVGRMIVLHVQLVYNLVALGLSWFALSAFLLTLFIVNDISGDPPENAPVSGFPFGRGTNIFNAVLQVVYLCTIVLQFVLALGSRPKRQYWAYFVSFVVFGMIQLYFVMNIIYLGKRVLEYRLHLNNGADGYNYINEFYADIGSVTVTVAAVSVFGAYVGAGILSLDPWHLITTFGQFLFVSSSYTNVLTIYAFCNAHDISWGDKSNRAGPRVEALPSALVTRTADNEPAAVVEEVEAGRPDVEAQFDATVKRALTRPGKMTANKSAGLTLEDMLKTYRTRLIGVYIFSNMFLCVFVLNDSFKSLHFLGASYWHKIWFFRIWLWAQAGCFALRFGGCCWHRGARVVKWMGSYR